MPFRKTDKVNQFRKYGFTKLYIYINNKCSQVPIKNFFVNILLALSPGVA